MMFCFSFVANFMSRQPANISQSAIENPCSISVKENFVRLTDSFHKGLNGRLRVLPVRISPIRQLHIAE
ncbi:hypothetical protein SFRURICE_015102, partial [Spodoptera frugiperda]